MGSLQAVPIVGGIVATFISEYVPRRKQARLVGFVQDLGRQFEAERDRLDQEFVRTTEFERMFEDALDRVQTVRNEDKLGYWAALLAGVATHDRPPERDRERMIETLDAVRLPHLRLLHVIATTTEARPGLMAGGISDTLTWRMPDVPEDEFRRDWADLARHGVVADYVSGTMSRQGAGDLTARLTPYGREFVRMLRLEAGFAD
jgi:hypothetical protein